MQEVPNNNTQVPEDKFTIECTAGLPKEFVDYPKNVEFVYGDIANILIDLDLKDSYIVKLPNYEGHLEERKQFIKQCIDILNESGDDVVILIESFISHIEFPRDKYTVFKDNDKELINIEAILKRERDMLTELGFICINDYINYYYKEIFVYGNTNGKLIRKYIDKLTETR